MEIINITADKIKPCLCKFIRSGEGKCAFCHRYTPISYVDADTVAKSMQRDLDPSFLVWIGVDDGIVYQ